MKNLDCFLFNIFNIIIAIIKTSSKKVEEKIFDLNVN